MTHPPIILAHGGAGRGAMTRPQRTCLEEALTVGYEQLLAGASALESVEAVNRCLEASGLFNAGIGSRLQLDGARRMDAALMEGRGLRAGAVAGIEGIRHPIAAARAVMEHTPHVLLAGPPAGRFARSVGLARLRPPTAEQRRAGRAEAMRGAERRAVVRLYRTLLASAARRRPAARETVGAVAKDLSGSVAAGASTGGIAAMLPGRVGDTPLIGAGVYADDAGGAVSMTGIGEGIVRLAVAKEIVDHLIRGGAPSAAARRVLRRLVERVQGAAGALVLRRDGSFAIRHTTPHMAAGYRRGHGRPVVRDRF